jgi:hypothetical protein
MTTPDGNEGTICEHLVVRLVWVPVATGRQLRQQCQRCGCVFGKAFPHSDAKRNTPPLDEQAWARFKRQNGSDWAREFEERREQYRIYLQSEQWQCLRQKVFVRAGGQCEGCGEHPASEVHHLTYANIFAERLFQLVAVCSECHRLVHRIGAPHWLLGEDETDQPAGAPLLPQAPPRLS